MTTFVSLFSGVGGFDLGLEAAGWECVAQVEWDRDCQAVLAHHWPNVPRWSDVSHAHACSCHRPGVSSDERAPLASISVSRGEAPSRAGAGACACGGIPPADVIAFGSPCQDLSVAGQRAGMVEGSRSNLFYEATRIIREMRHATRNAFPRLVIWENVGGALSSAGGRDFAAVLDDLADCGAVDIAWRVLDARWFGVPQRRRRVFVVADFAGPGAGEIHAEPEGVCWHPRTGRQTRPDATDGTAGGAGERGEVVTTDYAHQLTTGGGKPGQGYPAAFVGAQVRRLTPVECERLMGWPDDHTHWRSDGTEVPDSTRYRMCGNGVASPVAEWLATQLDRALEAHP